MASKRKSKAGKHERAQAANAPGGQPGSRAKSPQTKPAAAAHPKQFPVVGVGASAGGLEAFRQLLQQLPADTGMGFVLVQHLDPEHESALTQILTRATSMPVREVTDSLRVEPNHVYVIPPDKNMDIVRGVLKLRSRPASRAPFRPINVFLESLAHDQRDYAIGVILSGTATDVLTSSNDPRDIETAYRLRANAYLIKPSGMDALEALTRSIKEFWLTLNRSSSPFG
jgi:chemotaxis response regulator CheB